MLPKVLIGCPTYEKQAYCLDRFITAIKNIDYPEYELLIVENTEDNDAYYKKIKENGINVIKDNTKGKARLKLEKARNIFRKKVLEENFDYLLTVDQDIIVPPNVLQKLINAKKDLISAVYFTHMEKNGIVKTIPVLFINTANPEQVTHLSIDEAFKDQIIKIRACGLGCLLISKKCLEKVDFNFESNFPGGEDVYFCKQAQEKGFEIFADTSVKCRHLILEQKDKWKDTEF